MEFRAGFMLPLLLMPMAAFLMPKIARGVDPSLDKEALRVVNQLPKWKPGKQRGKPVRVSYTVPINFQLQ
jgi:hypothetical protein